MSARALLSAGMLVTAGMLASRLLGFLRESMIAASYGSSDDAGMAIGLLIIPDYITGMLIGGALSATLLPAFSTRNEAECRALFWQAMLLSVLVFSLLAALIYSQSPSIIAVMHGMPAAVPPDALFWPLFSMPLAGAGGVITAWLQYHGRFTVPAFAHALFNLVIVLTLWLAPSGLSVLALGIFMAGLARLLLFGYGLSRTQSGFFWFTAPWQFSRRLFGYYASAVGNSFFSLLPQYAPYILIPLLAGQLALFNYAFKLLMLPAMLITTIIGIVLLPRFVHLRKEQKDVPEYARSLRFATLVAFCITLAMSLSSWHIVSLCFGYGVMTEENVREVARIFAVGIWALPGMVAGYLWQQIFYACERPGVPFKMGVAQAALCIPALWLAQQAWQESGVMAVFALLQTLPVFYFSYMAEKQGIVSMKQQWQGCAKVHMVALAVFIPLAVLFYYAALLPLAGLLAALLLGGAILSAGIYADSEMRQWVRVIR